MTAALALDKCPACGTATEPRRAERFTHPSLCFDCTIDELGEPWDEIKARTAAVERKTAQRLAQGKAK